MKHKKTITSVAFFLLGLGGLQAQETVTTTGGTAKAPIIKSQTIEIIDQIGGEGEEKGHSITTDDFDFFTVGVFSKTITVNVMKLDEYEEYTIKTPLTLIAKGKKDGIVSKYNRSGKLLWVTQLSATSYLNSNVIEVNVGGWVYVAGTFMGDFTYPVGDGEKTISSKGPDGDAFILQLNSKGKIDWVRQFGGTESTLSFSDLEIGSSNTIFLSGNFNGKTNFNTSANWAEKHPEFLTSGGTEISSNNGFILKLNYVAEFVWVKQITSDFDSYTTSMEVDNDNNIYLSGTFQESAKFSDNNELSVVAGQDSYVVKYNESGEVLWVKGFGSVGDEKITSIALNKDNKLIVCGNFTTEIDEEEGAEENSFLGMKSNGTSDGFILSLDSEGKVEWNKHIKNDLNIYLQSIATYDNNDALVVAYVKNQFERSMYTVKLNNTGTLLSETILSGGGTFGSIQANNVIINKGVFNDVFIIGQFQEILTLNSIEYPSKGRTDIFLFKIK